MHNVEEQVAWRGYRMASVRANLPERMQFGRTGRAEELVPGLRSKSDDTGETRFEAAKLDGAHQSREIAKEGSQGHQVC